MCRPADLSSALPVYTTTTTTEEEEEEEEGKDIMQSEGRGPLERVRRPGRLLSSSCVRRRKSRGGRIEEEISSCVYALHSITSLSQLDRYQISHWGARRERERECIFIFLSLFFSMCLCYAPSMSRPRKRRSNIRSRVLTELYHNDRTFKVAAGRLQLRHLSALICRLSTQLAVT